MTPVLDSRLVSPDSLIPLVRQRVSGPLDSFIRQAIIRASIAFCRESRLVHLERTFAEVFEGQTVTFASTCSINRQARQDVREPQVTASVIHGITSNGESLQSGYDYHLQSADSVRFLRACSNVMIAGAIEPVPNAKLIPAALVEDYSGAIADGATADLQLQPGKPWSNPEMGMMYQTRFNEAKREGYRFRIEATPDARVSNPVRRRSFF
ncbi:hypothetical protein [Plesiomonas shigelloides]|uniref:hypothetical protein n=1 Tax=Plesiomonas shigelloides TaxID=703 RepID=UPI000A11CAF8|nr:hypothetical protein [Plesiomonas shigelloides]